MTSVSPVPIAPEPDWSDDDRGAQLRAVLREEFLDAAGWDPGGEVFAPPRDHPLLGLRKCVVVDCTAGVRTPNADLCKVCVERFKGSGLTLEEFVVRPCGKKTFGQKLCSVTDCGRVAAFTCGLCMTRGAPGGGFGANLLPVA